MDFTWIREYPNPILKSRESFPFPTIFSFSCSQRIILHITMFVSKLSHPCYLFVKSSSVSHCPIHFCFLLPIYSPSHVSHSKPNAEKFCSFWFFLYFLASDLVQFSCKFLGCLSIPFILPLLWLVLW